MPLLENTTLKRPEAMNERIPSKKQQIKELIVQAHQRLGTSSITLYVFHPDTEQLTLAHYVGVERPGFMCGPAWEPIFRWEEPDRSQQTQLATVYLANEREYLNYKGEFLEGSLVFRKKATRSTFRDRQRERFPNSDFALYKICLFSTQDCGTRRLGQLFISFARARISPSQLRSEEEKVLAFAQEIRLQLGTVKPRGAKDRFLAMRMAIDHRFEQFTRDSLDPNHTPTASRRYRIAHFHRELIKLLVHFSNRELLCDGAVMELFLLQSERFAWRYSVQGSRMQKDKLLIPSGSLMAECIQMGKEFCLSNVRRSPDYETRNRIKLEPFLGDYTSIKIIPITIDGEVRVALRMLWYGNLEFRDDLLDKIRQIRSIATYAICSYDEWLQRNGIKASLALFARPPKKFGLAAGYEFLGRAGQVLGADRIVFHHVVKRASNRPSIGGSAKITLRFLQEADQFRTRIKARLVPGSDPHHGARENGATTAVLKASLGHCMDGLYCFDVLPKQPNEGEKVRYLLRVYTEKKVRKFGEGQDVPGGWRYDFDSTTNFPGTSCRLELKKHNLSRAHTEVVFPVRSQDQRKILGIAWIAFDNLQPIGWWERYFIRDLANSMANAIQESLLRLAVSNFNHLMHSLCEDAILDVTGVDLLDDSGLILGDAIPKPSAKRSLAKAGDVLRFIARKAREVGIITKPARFAKYEKHRTNLSEIIKCSWAVALGLGELSVDFKVESVGSTVCERSKTLTIWYDERNMLNSSIPDYAFSLLINVLSNALKHGRSHPYGVWVQRQATSLVLICINGGECPPHKNLLRDIILGERPKHRHGGVGMALIHHLTLANNGSWNCYDLGTAKKLYGAIPPPFKAGKTFFELVVPI